MRASPRGVKRTDALSRKKKTPRVRGFADLSPDIHDLPAILAASSVSLLANLRFLRDVHGQQISPCTNVPTVAIDGSLCKPWLTQSRTKQTLGFIL